MKNYCIFINIFRGNTICIPDEQREVSANYNDSVEYFMNKFKNGGTFTHEIRIYRTEGEHGEPIIEIWDGKHRYVVGLLTLCICRDYFRNKDIDIFKNLNRIICGCLDFLIKSNRTDSNIFNRLVNEGVYEGTITNEDKKSNVYRIYEQINKYINSCTCDEIKQIVNNLIDNVKSELKFTKIEFETRQEAIDWYNSQNKGAEVTTYDTVKSSVISKDKSFRDVFSMIESNTQVKAKTVKPDVLKRLNYACCKKFYKTENANQTNIIKNLLEKGSNYCMDYLRFEEEICTSDDKIINSLCLNKYSNNSFLPCLLWDLKQNNIDCNRELYYDIISLINNYMLRLALFNKNGHLEKDIENIIERGIENTTDGRNLVIEIYNLLPKKKYLEFNDIQITTFNFYKLRNNNAKRLLVNAEIYLEKNSNNSHWTALNWSVYDKDHILPKKACRTIVKNDKSLIDCAGNITLLETTANKSIKDSIGSNKEMVYYNSGLEINSNEFINDGTEEDIEVKNNKKMQLFIDSTNCDDILRRNGIRKIA